MEKNIEVRITQLFEDKETKKYIEVGSKMNVDEVRAKRMLNLGIAKIIKIKRKVKNARTIKENEN